MRQKRQAIGLTISIFLLMVAGIMMVENIQYLLFTPYGEIAAVEWVPFGLWVVAIMIWGYCFIWYIMEDKS